MTAAFKHVLIATDGSPLADKALEQALRLGSTARLAEARRVPAETRRASRCRSRSAASRPAMRLPQGPGKRAAISSHIPMLAPGSGPYVSSAPAAGSNTVIWTLSARFMKGRASCMAPVTAAGRGGHSVAPAALGRIVSQQTRLHSVAGGRNAKVCPPPRLASYMAPSATASSSADVWASLG